MGKPTIETRLADGVHWITLARPERRNALDAQLVGELLTAFRAAESEPNARLVVLGGLGPDFCAGADLEQTLSQRENRSPTENLADAKQLGDLFIAMRRLDKVIVAAVRGRALAGGAGLATACDIVIAADNAELGYPEVQLGLVPAMVGALLRRSVGEKIGFELLARGHRIGAAEAQRLGLVTRLVPAAGFDEGIRAYASELAARPLSTLTLIKRLYYGQDGLSFEEGIGRGAEVNVIARSTPEAKAGIEQFLARRAKSARPPLGPGGASGG